MPFWVRLLNVYLPRLYLQRFQLVLGALLLAYVPFALIALPAMFRSTLVLTAHGLAWVTMFTVVAAAVVMATRRIVLLCGPPRYNIDWPVPDERIGRWTFLSHLSLAAPIVVVSTYLSAVHGELGSVGAVLAALAGVAGAAAFLSIASAVYAWLVDASKTLPDLALPGTGTLFRSVHVRPVPQTWIGTMVKRFIDLVRPLLGPGYFEANGEIKTAHLYAAGVCATFGLLYWGAYFVGKPQYANDIPPLVFVLILATLVSLVLSGLSFLLDRHRVPVLLPAIAWLAFLSAVSNSDHHFELRRGEPARAPSPHEIAKTYDSVLTVVAVDGGGIQAAAWGATVLTRLEEASPGFHKSARMISAVSGGSVGTMYFLSVLRADRSPSTEELLRVREASMQGSLSEAGWGLAYPDLWRALVPIVLYRFEKDRGWAIEQAWRRHIADPSATLGEWTVGVREGWRPAMALNATGVETGQRFAFATFSPPDDWALDTVATTYPGYDIEVPTAARLSAAFPYVSPVASARPGKDIKAWHFADGGYSDNTGMVMAMRWLDTAIRHDETQFRNRAVVFIRIRSSPASAPATPKERAWAYEAIGPINTLLSVRTAAQKERAETELDFLQRLWCGKGVAVRKLEFPFELSIPGTREMKNPPLSWQLTAQEMRDLDAAWHTDRNQKELRTFLEIKSKPTAGGCAVPSVGAAGIIAAGAHAE